jgi:hypothetical protein
MRNQENERQDACGQTTVNLPTPQRVSGFARHLTRGRSMGVRNRRAIRQQAGQKRKLEDSISPPESGRSPSTGWRRVVSTNGAEPLGGVANRQTMPPRRKPSAIGGSSSGRTTGDALDRPALAVTGQQATFTDASPVSCGMSGIGRPIGRFPAKTDPITDRNRRPKADVWCLGPRVCCPNSIREHGSSAEGG